MRILALDHGSARCGCAISDPTGTIVRPIAPIAPPDPAAVAVAVDEHGVEMVLVGLPVSLDGNEGAQALEARRFAEQVADRRRRPGRGLRRAADDEAGRSLPPGRLACRRGLARRRPPAGFLPARAGGPPMSDDRDQTPPQTPPGEPVPPVDDPFLAEDPEAYERERRRLQREAKRRERSGRKSLASRVSGALDGAADKGREAIEQTKERATRTARCRPRAPSRRRSAAPGSPRAEPEATPAPKPEAKPVPSRRHSLSRAPRPSPCRSPRRRPAQPPPARRRPAGCPPTC